MRQNDIETLKEAKEYVFENEDSIKRIIDPSDLIYQDIDNWENTDTDILRDEIGMSLGDSWTFGINHPYGDLIRDIAVNRFVSDMIRIPRDHLVFGNDPEKCTKKGYWLNEWSRDFVTELVYENLDDIDYFHEYESEILQEIEASMIEARLKDF